MTYSTEIMQWTPHTTENIESLSNGSDYVSPTDIWSTVMAEGEIGFTFAIDYPKEYVLSTDEMRLLQQFKIGMLPALESSQTELDLSSVHLNILSGNVPPIQDMDMENFVLPAPGADVDSLNGLIPPKTHDSPLEQSGDNVTQVLGTADSSSPAATAEQCLEMDEATSWEEILEMWCERSPPQESEGNIIYEDVLADQRGESTPNPEIAENGSIVLKIADNVSRTPDTVDVVPDQQELEREVVIKANIGYHCNDSTPKADDESQEFYEVNATGVKDSPKTLYSSSMQCKGGEIKEDEAMTTVDVSTTTRGSKSCPITVDDDEEGSRQSDSNEATTQPPRRSPRKSSEKKRKRDDSMQEWGSEKLREEAKNRVLAAKSDVDEVSSEVNRILLTIQGKEAVVEGFLARWFTYCVESRNCEQINREKLSSVFACWRKTQGELIAMVNTKERTLMHKFSASLRLLCTQADFLFISLEQVELVQSLDDDDFKERRRNSKKARL
ncbi:hypothetical protein B0J11DRAFT_508378 [Dendryphion nanum]|uniref:Uncharacterized protein n=1 Tax=Dendryphion nanum TaxID=256645 RepID=A0A9P9IGV1_9PLEO|nr:hypothetical protein B0J11DRAFT_508378 [Dendryphion nanum]